MLIDRLNSLLVEADRLWSEAAERTRPGEIVCRTGCFGCCIGVFQISLPEALVARAAVATLPEAERGLILGAARRIVAEGASLFPGDAHLGVLDPGRSEAVDDRYFETTANTVCPMLALPSGRCRIYAARPVTCRTYGLAWARSGKPAAPACMLNFPDAPGRRRDASIDLDRLVEADQRAAEELLAAGFPAGAETTLAHALVGSAFGEFEGRLTARRSRRGGPRVPPSAPVRDRFRRGPG